MSILVYKESRILCQGITGSQGSFHAEQCIEYGSNIVAGVTPGKGGSTHLDVPVFNSVAEAKADLDIDVSMIFVPAKFAADAMKSAIESEIGLIVCITEGVPVQDMIEVKAMLNGSDSILLGPNCPGIITPDETKIGIMPGFIHQKGSVGIGQGKSKQVPDAIKKANEIARRNLIQIPLREGRTIHHDIYGKDGAGKIKLRAAPKGTGIIAGGPVRAVCEVLGIKDIVAKSLGTANPHNVIRACMKALLKQNSPKNISILRNKKISEIIEKRG